MLFARWQHHLPFCGDFSYAPLKAMVTKISKWSRIQNSFRINPKIESLVVCAIPDIPSKFQKDPFITVWVILRTRRQTNKVWQNVTSLAEVNMQNRLHCKMWFCLTLIIEMKWTDLRCWRRWSLSGPSGAYSSMSIQSDLHRPIIRMM